MNPIVREIRDNFVSEAIKSPTLISDLASMEKYISESYDGRSLIELLQNADDAMATSFYLEKLDETTFLVANNGRKFTKEDLLSLCRSGASTKKRKSGTIGFRGIGFKSVVNFSDTVHLISGDIKITFSRERTKEIIGKNINVPLIRIPHDFLENRYDTIIKRILNDNYNTIFIFEINKSTLKSEIDLFDNTCMFFLKYVNQIKFIYDGVKVNNISRNELAKDTIIANIFTENNIKKWLIFNNKNYNTSIAFQFENGQAIPTKDENYIHSFMPTKDKFSIPCKINGDFSTDPSRTRIILDDETKDTINNVAKQMYFLIMNIIKNENDKFSILNVISKIELNQLSNIIGKNINDYFYDDLQEKFVSHLKEYYGYNKICLQPIWLSDDDLDLLNIKDKYIIKRELLEKIDGLEKIFSVFKIKQIDITDFLNEISSKKFSHYTRINILKNLIEKYEFNMPNEIKEIIKKGYLFKDKQNNIITLENVNTIDDIDENFISELISIVNNIQRVEHFFIKFGIKFNSSNNSGFDNSIDNKAVNSVFNNVDKNFNTIQQNNISNMHIFSKKNVIPKWRSVEENVKLVLEEDKDILEVIDVSKRNIGYDLEAIYKDGTKRYYEVKSVNDLGDMFVMTNNELLTASQHPKQYYLCVVKQTDKKIEMCIINDPANTLTLEKRARVWEYICESYEGVKIEHELN